MTGTAFADLMPMGGNDMRSRMWQRFASMAVEALQQAAAILNSNGLGFDHTKAAGYWSSRPRRAGRTPVRVPLENGVTDPLVRALELVRRSAANDHLISTLQVYFVQQQPRATQKRVGSKAYTTDIQIRSLTVEHLDLRVEAKVLFAGRDVTAYCGQDGLLRFAHAEPYTDQPVGMMLGYTGRRADPHWLNSIEKKARSLPDVIGFHQVDLGRATVSASLVKSHATGSVLVLHLLLPFETDPSARALDASSARARSKRRSPGI